ncbi:hypothetical protein CGZ93_03320 [Enemella dayhoffiae]|uniref:Copper chaperone PCu(A)C n=1 Tax=Enemella dayhoffiae TaxID=2016507 RepID=A0A255HAW5_9ACTN|nr:hypothetical protein [Enemella dayhoffiae]OYO24436.1 hypothetical protein CGZ93_03320 [Enemella dayhoffiae]
MGTSKFSRTIAATALIGALAGLSACGTPQTLQPYTPAEGVNADITTPSASTPLKVRNLTVISRTAGQGFLAGAILAPADKVVPDGLVTRREPAPEDALTGVRGTALTPTGEPAGPPLQATANVPLPPGQLVTLTRQPAIQLNSPDLKPGLLVELTLSFRSGATTTLRVPVVDGLRQDYITVSPAPAK